MKQLMDPQRIQTILIGLAIILCAILCSPVGWSLILAMQVASLPQVLHPAVRLMRSLILFLPLVWLVLCVAAPVFSLSFLFSQKLRQYRSFISVCFIVWIIAWVSWPLRPSPSQLRKPGLVRITQQAKPLIQAIETYQDKNGQPPPRLSDLIPAYINEIPSTGAAGYPQFEYKTATEKSLFQSYELQVKTPIGGINWDVFVYWPEKKYPDQMYGGGIEVIGDWAYVHE